MTDRLAAVATLPALAAGLTVWTAARAGLWWTLRTQDDQGCLDARSGEMRKAA